MQNSTAGGPTTAIHVSIDHTEKKEQVPGISFKPQQPISSLTIVRPA